MFWLKTGVLSDKQVKRLLGKKIFIYPFNEDNLKGSTYNFTASVVAVAVSDSGNDKDKLLINENREIEVPPGTTALIDRRKHIC